jgi:thiamine biosynthesis protein ThiS
MAKIQLNGKIVAIKSKYSLFDLLKKYKLADKKIAVEHNGAIIPKASYKKKNLKENDKVEIVHFIGGG